MKIIVTAISDSYAHILNVENMRYGKLPLLDCWERILNRAFQTHEVLNLKQSKP